jgi:hypothetical protein
MCALRFIDSFDHYVTADMTEKWTANDFCAINATNGRRGTGCMRHSSFGSFLTLTLDNQAIWVVGVALRITALPASGVAIIQWRDSTTVQADLRIEPTGLLTMYRGGIGGTLLGTSTAVVTVGIYNYFEFSVRVHQTLGEAHARLNGTTVLSLTNINTQQSANAYAQNVRLGNIVVNQNSAMGTQDYDDVYICDGTGSTPTNTFLGDCRVDVLLPSADGSNSAWTPSTGTTHSTLVDETVPNDDTDYLSTSTSAARDAHALTDLPALPTPTIFGIQHCLNARKDDAGTRQVRSLLKSGVTTQAGSKLQTLAIAYAYYTEIWPTDPATGTAWTVAGVNALEAGVELV